MASKVDTSDPAIRRLVYSHYRGILGKYNDKANSIVSQLPKERVVEDQGVSRQLEAMIRQSNQIQNNGNSNAAPANGPPPPPPPPSAGNIAAVRIASEIGPRKSYEPPAAIQNAMMTKDKKPFTYTPGGLNLNEIRSPRMARRISRNAHTEDSCTPQAQQAPTSPGGVQPLPPAALAAMQPQIAIPVFPPGGGAPHTLPPPPPPPPPSGPCPPTSAPPPPAPPPPTLLSNKPLDFPPRPEFLSDIASHPPLRPVGQPPRSTVEQQPPEFLADIASHPPLRPVGQPPRSLYEPQPSQIQVQLKPVSPKPIDQNDATPIGQVPFVPRPQIEIPVQNAPFISQGVSSAQNQMRTPPIQSVKPPATPPMQLSRAPPTPPIQSVRASPIPPAQPATPPVPSQPVLNPRQPQTPSTPTLNKSPAPWLTNKPAAKETQPPWTVRQQSSDSQPVAQPVQQSYLQPTQETSHQPVTRVIPIQIEGREPATTPIPPTPQNQYGQTQQKYVQPQSPQYSNQQQQYQQPSQNFTQAQPQYVQPPQPQQQYMYPQQQYVQPQFQQFGGQMPPQQYMQNQPFQQESQVKTRIIPIQMEGSNDNHQQSQKPIYQNQNSQPGNVQNRNQNGDADPRKFQTQTSWSGNPTQSRSFRVLQKITGSDDEPQAPVQPAPQPEVILVNRVYPSQATEPVSGEYNGWGTNTPPTYPNYWYNPPQTPEEQQQFWDHYNAMCNYMAHMNATAMRYSPYPYPSYPFPYPPYPSDTEDYSNSSSDEMTLYGKMFKEHTQLMQQQALNQNEQVVTPSDATPSDFTETEGEEDTSDSDTEVEEKSLNPISSIRSVPNINIYACNSDESSEETESSEEEEETEDDSLPHQLSVIYEESDFSSEDGRKSNAKSPYESDNSSTSTLKNKDEDETAVKVRLPLQLKFTRSENDEEVATLIVGNSEMEASKTSDTEESSLIITDIIKEDSDPDITATIVIKKSKPKVVSQEREDSPIDFWKELNGDSPSTIVDLRSSEDDSKQEEGDLHWEDDSSSTSVQTVKKGVSGNDTSSEAEASGNLEEQEESVTNSRSMYCTNHVAVVDESSEQDESSEEEIENDKEEENKNDVTTEKIETEDDDDDESDSSSSSSSEDDSEHSNVFHDNTRQENDTVKKKDLISSKSFEESEDDSGVTSDLSRHISETDTDPECGSELSKMSRYQRAATHSRLFKLLQEQCEAEDNAEKLESISQRKERLTLPLNNTGGDDSLSSSSGVNSPSSPTVTDRLVKELIQSLLSRKKGRHFRKLPMEKLHAAALRILQEDTDTYDTVSTSDESNFFLSPVNNHNKANAATYTDSSLINPESYGGNYYDYCNYYSTWGTVDSAIEPDYDIVPSKTFKILQGQTQGESTGVKVRCPRVPSSKNLREQLTTPIPSFSSPIPKET